MQRMGPREFSALLHDFATQKLTAHAMPLAQIAEISATISHLPRGISARYAAPILRSLARLRLLPSEAALTRLLSPFRAASVASLEPWTLVELLRALAALSCKADLDYAGILARISDGVSALSHFDVGWVLWAVAVLDLQDAALIEKAMRHWVQTRHPAKPMRLLALQPVLLAHPEVRAEHAELADEVHASYLKWVRMGLLHGPKLGNLLDLAEVLSSAGYQPLPLPAEIPYAPSAYFSQETCFDLVHEMDYNRTQDDLYVLCGDKEFQYRHIRAQGYTVCSIRESEWEALMTTNSKIQRINQSLNSNLFSSENK